MAAKIAEVPRNITIDHQDTLDAWEGEIQAVFDSKQKNSANYNELDSVIQIATIKKNRKVPVRGEEVYLYIDAGREALQNEIDKANAARERPIDEQAVVDAYINKIQAAADALIAKPADYKDINTSINDAVTEITKTYKGRLIYTEDSINKLRYAISVVEENLTIERQDDIDDWKAAIDLTISQLVLNKADYTEVNRAKAAAEIKRDTTAVIRKEEVYIYTDATRSAVTAAINNIIEDLDILAQDQVDGFARAINEAADALVEKDADYTSIDATKVEVQESMVEKVGKIAVPAAVGTGTTISLFYLLSLVFRKKF